MLFCSIDKKIFYGEWFLFFTVSIFASKHLFAPPNGGLATWVICYQKTPQKTQIEQWEKHCFIFHYVRLEFFEEA